MYLAEYFCNSVEMQVPCPPPPRPEQIQGLRRAREAAAKRTKDPLKSWVRPQREECPICLLPLPLRRNETLYHNCCGKTMCKGKFVQLFISGNCAKITTHFPFCCRMLCWPVFSSPGNWQRLRRPGLCILSRNYEK